LVLDGLVIMMVRSSDESIVFVFSSGGTAGQNTFELQHNDDEPYKLPRPLTLPLGGGCR